MKMTPHRHGRRWETEELRHVMARWEEGAAVETIAQEVGLAPSGLLTLIGRLRRDGIPLSRRTRGHRCGRHNRPWTQEEVEYLFRRRLAGATAEEIGLDLKRSAGAVASMIAKLRKGGAPIAMMGNGCRRLWSVEALKGAAVGRFDDGEIRLAENVPD